jgi:hypothetical protein
VFPVRYELDSYILFRRNSVFKGLKQVVHIVTTVFLKSKFAGYAVTVHHPPPRRIVTSSNPIVSMPEGPAMSAQCRRHCDLTPSMTGPAIQATVSGSRPDQCYPCQINRRPVQLH